jgi:hypothetical protein
LNAALALAAGRRELRRVTWRHGTGKHAQSDRGDDFLTALDQAICTPWAQPVVAFDLV